MPLDNGAGWLTSGVSVTRMVRLPWAIATVLIRTLAPITMVPLASSITTMAGLSGSTRRSSSAASASIGSRLPKSSATVRGSVALATGPTACVDRGGDATRGGQVRVAQAEPERVGLVELVDDLALHRGAVGDARRGGHAAGHRAGGAARGDRAGGERALGHRVNLAVGGEQRRDQQRAAGQVGGVAERGDRHVDPAAAAREGGQIGGDHHRGDVLGGQLGHLVPGVHAEPLQHADQRFAGEHRVVQLVAGVVQPDHQAVADELVLADAFDVRDVLDAHLGQGRQSGHEGNQQGQQTEEAVQGGLGGSGSVRNLRQSRAVEGKPRASAKQRAAGRVVALAGRHDLPGEHKEPGA